jgi:hypothetical protein
MLGMLYLDIGEKLICGYCGKEIIGEAGKGNKQDKG